MLGNYGQHLVLILKAVSSNQPHDKWSVFADVDAYTHVTFHPDDSVAMVLVTWSAEALLCQAVASQNDLRDLQRQLSEHYSSECSYNAVHLCSARTLHGSCAL